MRRRSSGPWFLIVVLMAASPGGAGAADVWKMYAGKGDEWYRGPEGRRVAGNILSNQAGAGDWPKNVDNSAEAYVGEPGKIRGTFDNGATVGELRFLARAFRATDDPKARDSFFKGLDHVLAAQYPTGGWPQTAPPGRGYARYITFNDNTMINLMGLVRDVAGSEDFRFVGEGRRAASRRAFDAGIACILACQVKVDGVPTVWCAQHDEVTLEPRPARTFELVSLSGSESAGILILLMSLERPSLEVARAIEAGVRWFDRAKLAGIRQVVVDRDRRIIADPAAPPLWARFYEIGTDRPFFCGRDGVKKDQIAEIEAERRNGYAWYGDWGSRVAERHARWSRAR